MQMGGQRCGRGEPRPIADVVAASPVPVQMWHGVSPVPVQMWQGASPVPVQMWQGRAQSRCRCGRGEPRPGVHMSDTYGTVGRFSSDFLSSCCFCI